MAKKIGIVVGSLRKESYNMKVARNVKNMIPDGYEVVIADIGSLPMYNEDLESDNPPKEWQDFRDEIKTWDAVLFITAEYNRSMPACIKNAIDVGSRPYGKNIWAKKPGGVISASIGGLGGFGANHHLRQTATFVDIYMMQQPEVYLSNIIGSLDGEEANKSLKSFLGAFVAEYINWIEKF